MVAQSRLDSIARRYAPRRRPAPPPGAHRRCEPSRAGPSEPRASGTEQHDRTEHLAALHATEGGLDVAQGDGLADEAVEVEPPLEVELDEDGKSREGRHPRTSSASAGRPGRRTRSSAGRCASRGSGRRPGRGCRPGRGVEGLLHHRRVAHRLDADVRPVAPGERTHRLDRVGRRRVDQVGAPKLGRGRACADRGRRRSPWSPRRGPPRHRSAANPPAAEHGDRVP